MHVDLLVRVPLPEERCLSYSGLHSTVPDPEKSAEMRAVPFCSFLLDLWTKWRVLCVFRVA